MKANIGYKELYYLTDYSRDTKLIRVFAAHNSEIREVTGAIAAITERTIKDRKHSYGIAFSGCGYTPSWQLHTKVCRAAGKSTKEIGYNKL